MPSILAKRKIPVEIEIPVFTVPQGGINLSQLIVCSYSDTAASIVTIWLTLPGEELTDDSLLCRKAPLPPGQVTIYSPLARLPEGSKLTAHCSDQPFIFWVLGDIIV